MKLMLRFLRPHRKLTLLTIALLILDVTGALFVPTLVAEMVNLGTSGAPFEAVVDAGIKMALVSLAASVFLAVLLVRRVFPRPFAMFCLSLVLAGAIGNLIDRVALGFVTDMFETLFMNFAVFNVADICVVCGGIAFCAYYLLCHGKEEERHDPPAAAG